MSSERMRTRAKDIRLKKSLVLPHRSKKAGQPFRVAFERGGNGGGTSLRHVELKRQKIRKIRPRVEIDFHDRPHKFRPLCVDRARREFQLDCSRSSVSK